MDLREPKEFLRDIIGYVITFIIIILFFTFIISIQSVSGNSMHPTLEEGDLVIVNKVLYYLGDIKRNDVVVVKNDESKTYVKRVIGLPGEKVEYIDQTLYINGSPYKEESLSEITDNFLFEDICSKEECPDEKIPAGKYLLLGDNRRESEDSRTDTFGLRDKKDITGKITIKIWPFKTIGLIK